MIGLWLWLGAAAAADEAVEPADVVEVVRDGVVVNWTRLTVEATSDAEPWGVESGRKTVEHRARQQLGPGILEGAQGVRVDGEHTVADLEAAGALGEAIANRAKRWSVAESRYYASGRIELTGALELGELLRPWTIDRAAEPPPRGRQPRFTGVLVDARGLSVEPAFAPQLLGADGSVLFDGTVWRDVATVATPVVYVDDPAHPAATRAGDHPLVVRAEGVQGVDLRLSAEDTVRYRTAMQGARAPGEGKVAIVVGP